MGGGYYSCGGVNHALLVCLPKKPTSTTPDGHNAYHSNNTRPLAISNTDNRLLASACRLRWETIAAEHVHPHQRGFLPKRSMLYNIVDIDHLSHMYSLDYNDLTLILYWPYIKRPCGSSRGSWNKKLQRRPVTPTQTLKQLKKPFHK